MNSQSHIPSLLNAFLNAGTNTEKANILLNLCTLMEEGGIGFPQLRHDFPAAAAHLTIAQLNHAAVNLKDDNGNFLIPSNDKTSITTTPDGFDALRRWGYLFLDITQAGLDRAIETKYVTLPASTKNTQQAADLIKQPNMLRAAVRKFLNIFEPKR